MIQTVLLGDIGRVVTGKTPPKENPEYWGYELDFITPTDFKDSRYTQPARKLSGAGQQAMRRIVCPANSVIVTCIGSDMGKVALAENSFVSNQQINTLIVDPEKANPGFIYYLLKMNRPLLRKYAESGGSTMPIINKSTFEKLSFVIPDLETQKKVADMLGTIDEKIELNRRMNETLEQMGQALFRHYFITNPEAEKWEEAPVGSLIESALGGDWGKEEPDEKHTQQVRVIRGTDMDGVKNGNIASVPMRFVEEKKYLTRQLRVGDVLIEISGGSNTQSTGRSLYIDQTTLDLLGGSVIPASFCRVIRTQSLKKASILFTFLEYLYDIGAMWDYQNRSTGISNFQYTFFVENARIRCVSDDVEEDFYDKIQPLITQRAQNAQQIQTLTTLRDTLLPRLISGKIRV